MTEKAPCHMCLACKQWMRRVHAKLTMLANVKSVEDTLAVAIELRTEALLASCPECREQMDVEELLPKGQS